MGTNHTIVSDAEIRAALLRHWEATNAGHDDAHAIYDEDSVLEFPQSGERFRGRASIKGFRERYPAAVQLETRGLSGSGPLWVGEHVVHYDGVRSVHGVNVIEMRGTTVVHERIYFGESFEAPAWREPWADGA